MTTLNTLTVPQLTLVYNSGAALAGYRPIKRFESKPAALARITETIKKRHLHLIGDRLVKAEPKGAKVAKKASQAERVTRDLIIMVVNRREPKRITGRNPYAIYADGMTVQQAIDKGVKQRDVAWDSKTGAIGLYTRLEYAYVSETGKHPDEMPRGWVPKKGK